MSAFDKNLSAKASSRKPRTTLTFVIQLPDFGKELSQAGKAAKKPNGMAKARENPSMTKKGPVVDFADSTSADPTIGPVHEKETNASVKAIKKMPMIPPVSESLSDLLVQELGSVISKYPKNENAKLSHQKLR